MLHKARVWDVHELPIDELVVVLAGDENLFCLCAGFRTPAGTLLVNDSLRLDGLQEYAVLRRLDGRCVQVESLTTTWCTRGKLTELLEAADRGEWDGNAPWAVVSDAQLEHGSTPCPLCR